MNEDKSLEEWIELINGLRNQQGKIPWKLEKIDLSKGKGKPIIVYRVVTITDIPVNPSLGKRYRKHNTILEMLTFAYTLLIEP